MPNAPLSDTGFVVYNPTLKCFWMNPNWTLQPREAKIYHSKLYAQRIVDRFPNERCRLMHIDVTVSELPENEIYSASDPYFVSFETTYAMPDPDPDHLAMTDIDGYPANPLAQGAVICTIFLRKNGDFYIRWDFPEYKNDPDVLALIEKAKNDLKNDYL